jgi:NADH-quinone oxidoreductase subunit J
MIQQVLFYIFATVLLGAALAVITVRNPVHSVLSLVLAFFTSAALWLLLEAEFLAIVLVLVYVGAVMVLFLFVVMMLDINVDTMREGFTRYLPLGAGVTLLILLEMAVVLTSRQFELTLYEPLAPRAADYSNSEALGHLLYTAYVYPFEIAAVILLVAIIAAISLTMRRREGRKYQDAGWQVSVRPADRLRIVKMPTQGRAPVEPSTPSEREPR